MKELKSLKIGNHLAMCKEINPDSFENVTNKQFVYKSYILNMYKYDLALNNIQGFKWNKIQPIKQST